jgi:dipeptidyl aminopeptidase/acylaminoacyl peptidase
MSSYRDFLPSRLLWPAQGLSADGGRVAYVDDSSGSFNITVQPVAGGGARQLTTFPNRTVWELSWHPDGRSLVFEADVDGDEKRQIFLVDAAGGQPRALTDAPGVQFNLGFGDPFSPDGTRLVYAGNDREPTNQDILLRDLTTSEVRRVLASGGMLLAGQFSPDGARLCALHLRDSSSDHVAYVVPAGGGAAGRLTPEDSQSLYWPGPWLPDGSGFLVLSNADREFTGLAALDADSGKLSWLETPPWDIDDVAMSADGRVLVWLVNVDGASELHARDLVTGRQLPTPVLPTGKAWCLETSAGGETVTMQLSTPTDPANVVSADLATGELRKVTDITPAGADRAGMVSPELVHIPAPEGRRIPAYLYRPRGRAGEQSGVVLAIHGGPTVQERPGYQAFYQYLLHHGVGVLAPNVGGSTGYGRSYMMRVYRDWGGRDLADFAAVAEWLRAQPWVDPARIGLYGRSYGGFAVLSCVARLPEVGWAAAVDVCGISNLLTLSRSSPPTWRSRVAAIIGDPDTDGEFLLSRSPVTYADNIRTPLFILQGANDPRVPQQESDQIVERLRSRGVEVRYDVYPDEGHGFAKRHNRIQADTDAGQFLLDRLAR